MDDWKRVSTTSERLREALDKANMKQADLARVTGLDKGSIHHYLTGKYEPKARSIKKMASALSVDEMWLWGYDVSEEENVNKEPTPADQELSEMLETLRTREDMRMLFKLGKEATPEDVRQAVKIIEALRKND